MVSLVEVVVVVGSVAVALLMVRFQMVLSWRPGGSGTAGGGGGGNWSDW